MNVRYFVTESHQFSTLFLNPLISSSAVVMQIQLFTAEICFLNCMFLALMNRHYSIVNE